MSYVVGSLGGRTYTTPSQISAIEITPLNRVYTVAGPQVSHFFYCTGYSRTTQPLGRQTHLAQDLTNNRSLTWTLTGPDGQPVATNRARISSASPTEALGGVLRILDSTLPNGVYTITARLSTGTGQQAQDPLIDSAKILLQLQ